LYSVFSAGESGMACLIGFSIFQFLFIIRSYNDLSSLIYFFRRLGNNP